MAKKKRSQQSDLLSSLGVQESVDEVEGDEEAEGVVDLSTVLASEQDLTVKAPAVIVAPVITEVAPVQPAPAPARYRVVESKQISLYGQIIKFAQGDILAIDGYGEKTFAIISGVVKLERV